MKRRLGSIFGTSDFINNEPSDQLVLPTCFVGVEIEVEGIRQALPAVERQRKTYLQYNDNILWEVKNDGSLRTNGKEFVSKKLCGKQLVTALLDIDQFLGALRPKPTWSRCTSVHVHLDVTDLTVPELMYLIGTYILVEDLLFDIAGPDRKDNFYCMAYSASEDLQQLLGNLWEQRDNDLSVIRQITEFPKYSALNIGAARTFGSIEFRHHHGTHDADTILLWVNIIMSLKKACYDKIPADLPELFSSNDPSYFLEQLFGTLTPLFLVLPDYAAKMRAGVQLLQDVLRHNLLIKTSLAFTKAPYLNNSPTIPVPTNSWLYLDMDKAYRDDIRIGTGMPNALDEGADEQNDDEGDENDNDDNF